MPQVVFDIENSFATITRYVVKGVMEQLMFLTGISNAEIIYNEPLGYGKNAAANSDPNAPALKLDAKDYFIVTYNERFDEQTIDPLSNVIEHVAIYQHSKLGINLRPITNKANIEFNLVYRSKSYNTLAVWLSRFQRNKIVREPHNYHDILYNYTIPEVIGAYLYDVYHLMMNVEPYTGLTLKEYMKTHYCEGLMSRSNLSKTKNALAINVNSKYNLGRFTSLPDEISSDKDKLTHEISFNYTLTYDKVVELLLEYQIFIHNQRVDTIYDNYFVRENYPKKTDEGRRTFTGLIHEVTARPEWYKVDVQDIFLEPIDKFLPTFPAVLTSTMLMAPMQVDGNSLTLVENINNLPNPKFPNWIKPKMLEFHEEVTKTYGFPFMLTLYAVDDKQKISVIEMDATGLITTTSDMDLRKRYYLRLSLLLDLRKLPLWLLRLLAKDKDFMLMLLLTINPKADLSKLKYLSNGTIIDIKSLLELLNDPSFINGIFSIYGYNHSNKNAYGYYINSNEYLNENFNPSTTVNEIQVIVKEKKNASV